MTTKEYCHYPVLLAGDPKHRKAMCTISFCKSAKIYLFSWKNAKIKNRKRISIPCSWIWQNERQRGNKTVYHTQLTVVRETKLYIHVAGGRKNTPNIQTLQSWGGWKGQDPMSSRYITHCNTGPKQSQLGQYAESIPGTQSSHGHPGATRFCSADLLGMKVSPTSSSCSHFLPYSN